MGLRRPRRGGRGAGDAARAAGGSPPAGALREGAGAGVPIGGAFDEGFLRRLERLSLQLRRVTSASGGRPGQRRAPAADFIDHRPYSPGDDQRHIDWHAAARHDALYVKVGRVTQSASLQILLDLSPSMTLDPQKRRLALDLAAALGWLSLAQGDRVALWTFPGAIEPAWQAARGAARGADYLARVAGLEGRAAGATRLEPLMAQVARRAGTGGLLVLISDLWLVDDLDAALARVPGPRWELLVLQLLGRSELDPQARGPVELVDAESGERRRLLLDDALRASYRAALGARLERLRRVVGGRGGSHALLPADWSLERAVIPYLQRRGVLGS